MINPIIKKMPKNMKVFLDSQEREELIHAQQELSNAVKNFCFVAMRSGEFHSTEDIEAELQDECIEASADILGNIVTLMDFHPDQED